jgi:aminoglycoside 6'-N-acetyltransferase
MKDPSSLSSPYAFRPAAPADLPMLQVWLRTREVVRWWGEPAAQLDLLRGDLSEPRMVMRIVSYHDVPFAYAQDYDVASWPQQHFCGLAPGTRAIDAFIGEPAMIGRGHGSGFLRALAQRLIDEGAPLVAIDPDVINLRAQRAYEKAGFRRHSVVQTSEGPAVLMLFNGCG